MIAPLITHPYAILLVAIGFGSFTLVFFGVFIYYKIRSVPQGCSSSKHVVLLHVRGYIFRA